MQRATWVWLRYPVWVRSKLLVQGQALTTFPLADPPTISSVGVQLLRWQNKQRTSNAYHESIMDCMPIFIVPENIRRDAEWVYGMESTMVVVRET